ncbi:MAG: hypothetical protein PHQ40_09995 [Anaerolineaceae bacterium]|nr:hypothetical protein [Anaerolineaceae bacterium]
MNVGNSFDGDENDTLKWVQHDTYSETLWLLYRCAADHYLLNVRYTWEFPDFVPIIRNVNNFDHRVLQDGHDLIAGYYRFLFCPRPSQLPFPQGFDPKTYYLQAWKAYYFQEVGLLGEQEEIAAAIVSAVAFENTPRGYTAEGQLHQLLCHRYQLMAPMGVV